MLTTPYTHTQERKGKQKEEEKKQKRLNGLQTLLKLVLRICRLQTLDGGGFEEVEKRWKAVCNPSGTSEGTDLSHFINMTLGYCW